MELKQVKSEGLKQTFEVIVQADEMTAQHKIRLEEFQKSASLPGFRPGKVPLSLLEKKYGAKARSEVTEKFLREAGQRVVAEHNLKPASQPQYHISQDKDGKDFKFQIDIESLPDIKPKDFKKIKIQRLKVKISDEDIEKALKDVAKAQNRTQEVKKPRKCKKDDTLVCTVDAFWKDENGQLVSYEEGAQYQLELGKNKIDEKLESHLIGKSFPGKVEVEISLSNDYPNKKLAGKDVLYKIDVKELREPVDALVDEALAKEFGVESLDKLREMIKKNLEDQCEEAAFYHSKRKLLDALDEENKFDLPESMVKREFDYIWKEYNKAENDTESAEKTTEEDRKQYQALAERRVRLGLLLAHVGQENKIEVPREKIANAIYAKASAFPGQEKQVIEYYQTNQQAAESLRAQLFEDEVALFILSQVTSTEKQVTMEKLNEHVESLSSAIE